MADEKIIFSMNGVSKILPHNNKVILKDIYLSFFYGAKIGIIGLNGAGKSTVMKIIAGIEQLKATPADGDLVSIADRLGSDYTYMKNETDLDIEQGYVAVEAGRGYVSDNGDAVTKELTARIKGLGLAAAAAVLALIAGLLGIFGLARASGVMSVIAALAAVAGAVFTMDAELTFSKVAGTSGSTLVLAGCAVLALAALINGLAAIFSREKPAAPAA